jgi:hypothetical protein
LLTSILPGLRDVRTPLACGYMWLVAAWLAFADHLPRTRPSAGIAASFWDLGGHVGKAAILAAITFSAYLIGAILEFDPAQLWRSRGIPSATSVLRSIEFGGISIKLAELEQAELDQNEGNRPDSASDVVTAGDMNQEGEKSKAPEGPVITADQVERETQRVERSVESLREAASGSGGVETMQALATALQDRSTELFGRYDRLQAEASLRLNIAAPLATLLELVIWRSPLLLWTKLPLSFVPVVLAAILLRQSLLRVRGANQVLIMAERVGIFEEQIPITISPPKVSS